MGERVDPTAGVSSSLGEGPGARAPVGRGLGSWSEGLVRESGRAADAGAGLGGGSAWWWQLLEALSSVPFSRSNQKARFSAEREAAGVRGGSGRFGWVPQDRVMVGGAGSDLLPPSPSTLTHALRGAERPPSHASLISSSKTLQRFSPRSARRAESPKWPRPPSPSWPCSATTALQTRCPSV